ncbi:hypothetical protein RCI35_001280 [Enterobacter hormaechei]|nr:hypothetical protein [Enterobacter hormaechei]
MSQKLFLKLGASSSVPVSGWLPVSPISEKPFNGMERDTEDLRAQLKKLRRMVFCTRSEKLSHEVTHVKARLKQLKQESDRCNGREDAPQVPCQSRYRHPLPREHLSPERHRLESAEPCRLHEVEWQSASSPQGYQRGATGAGCQPPESNPHRQDVELTVAQLSNWVEACCRLIVRWRSRFTAR